LFEGPAPRGTKLEDRHALYRPIMRSALRHELRHTGIFEAEFLAEQGTLLVEPVVLCCKSYPRIDTIGSPGTCVCDGVVGQ
jgi:hypothetical protein